MYEVVNVEAEFPKPANIRHIEIDRVAFSAWTLRPLNEKLVSELVRSIGNAGLLQPIVVRRSENGGKYEVVCGNHRLEACRRLGHKRISALVVELNDEQAFLARVSENLLKNTYVDPIEEANGYRMLLSRGWTIDEIAKRVGKSDSYICERLAVIDRLDKQVLTRLSRGDGVLTPSHAELLAKIRDSKKQMEVAEFVERKRLSVRTLERLLSGAPLPKRIELEAKNLGYRTIRVPTEFIDAVGIGSERWAHIYVDGRKLIIENIYRTKRAKFTRVNRNNHAIAAQYLEFRQAVGNDTA
jgi:ParB/RepB/Spo0J family partition protein